MKKFILSTMIALMTIFTACKKQATDNEWYAVQYQTINDTLVLSIEGSKGINSVNESNPVFHSKDAVGVISTTVEKDLIRYVVPMNGNTKVSVDFKKLDGSISTLEMQKNGSLLNTRIK